MGVKGPQLIFGPLRPREKGGDRDAFSDGNNYTIGIDAGSKTIKVAVFDPTGKLVYSTYNRHRTNISNTLADALHDVCWRVGDIDARIAVTGSAGIEVARLLEIPFVQEVVAVTHAVECAYPNADAIIELGGEDSKVVFLTGGLEQRMNSTCAGGTGGFIDTIAYMLGVRTSEMSSLAFGSAPKYPIASRCAVFAQTDVRPLLNTGASKADIAASVHDAVVRQTLGGLACGRSIQGNVVFLGGPLQFNDDLVFRFRRALNLSRDAAIKPVDAHLFTAFGAAMEALKNSSTIKVGTIENELRNGVFGNAPEGNLDKLPPLFDDFQTLEAFKEKHAGPHYPRADLTYARGPIFLGIDAGSTTAKLVLLDSDGRLLLNIYEPNEGDVIEVVRKMLIRALKQLPRDHYPGEENTILPFVAHATATGYGEEVLMAAFGVDSGIVETVAHAKAALSLVPDASFVLDIGGQDMKALWINNGQVQDAVLNEACSSGCGSFLGGTAHAVGESEFSFAEKALRSASPVDLGTKCTVFMSSRVKHAQKVGTSVEDIAAGCAYSVVQNALYKIIGSERVARMGDKVVVQGGTFKSDAVLRAFELLSGSDVTRPDQSALMGAIGAALVARERYKASASPNEQSTLLSSKELEGFAYDRRTVRCDGCQNSCILSVLNFADARSYVSGNRCERGKVLMKNREALGAANTANESLIVPDLISFEQRLIERFSDRSMASDRGAIKIGLPASLHLYESMPFWHTLFSYLGFDVISPSPDCEHIASHDAWQTVSAESVCYAAKLMHPRIFSLRDKGATHIFLPHFKRNQHCAVAREYSDLLIDSIEFLRDGNVKAVHPRLECHTPKRMYANDLDREVLRNCIQDICCEVEIPLRSGEFILAFEAAMSAQSSFEEELEKETEKALAWLQEDKDRHGIVLAGRSYHIDRALSHDINRLLQESGFAVFGQTGLLNRLKSMQIEKQSLDHDWRSGKSLLRTAQFVSQADQLDMVCLCSFGCGYDAVSMEEIKLIFERARKPFTALKIDEMVDISHIKIRLRTLTDIIKANTSEVLATKARERQCSESCGTIEFESLAKCNGSNEQIPTHEDRYAKYTLSVEDVMRARASTPADVCFTARAIAGQVISYLKDNPTAETVHVPLVCIKCLVDSVPTMVELATGKSPEYVWSDDLSCFKEDQPDHAARREEGARPKIGILGNVLHCFEPLMNDGLLDMLNRFGCDVVLPDAQALFTDDVRYEDQLRHFTKKGVQDVIYLQSFGCTKANVRVRGQMHDLRKAFPHIRITVIDYDPDSSELNRENRIRLAVEAASRRQLYS